MQHVLLSESEVEYLLQLLREDTDEQRYELIDRLEITKELID